jgi:hypothetical protein
MSLQRRLLMFDSSLRLARSLLLARNDVKLFYNHPMPSNDLNVGDRVKVFLDSKFWKSEGWFEGTIIRIDPYSEHRNFYWVELDIEAQPMHGGRTGMISVLNPKNIMRL